ncbi:hypothetical protein NDU88_003016 [Pleurodeles waltl]|uniref:Uncharacterized protein n=1 Tax=Pleurodeles waltl TaxID=8319 RepID=A0AAV7NPS2_PLEWA|nr:hypothetical protein NDU88_003016 [Pleurodeles waltl]
MGPRPQKEKVKGACGFCHHREQTLDSGVLYKTPDDEVAAHFNCMVRARGALCIVPDIPCLSGAVPASQHF